MRSIQHQAFGMKVAHFCDDPTGHRVDRVKWIKGLIDLALPLSKPCLNPWIRRNWLGRHYTFVVSRPFSLDESWPRCPTRPWASSKSVTQRKAHSQRSRLGTNQDRKGNPFVNSINVSNHDRRSTVANETQILATLWYCTSSVMKTLLRKTSFRSS